MISVNEKYISANSKDNLILKNPKDVPYMVFTVNNTLFDRTQPVNFVDEYGVKYNSLAHYIAYQKALLLGLSGEACAEIREFYRNVYPIIRETDILPYEMKINSMYHDEMERVPVELKMEWHNNCVKYATQGIMLLAETNSEYMVSLVGTGNDVLVEDSSSLLWGIIIKEDKDMPYPKKWIGDNGFGQALMAARDILKSKVKKLKFEFLSKKVF